MFSQETEVILIQVLPIIHSRGMEVLGLAEGHDRKHAAEVALAIAAGKNPSATMSKTDSSLLLHYDGRIYGRIFLKRMTTGKLS